MAGLQSDPADTTDPMKSGPVSKSNGRLSSISVKAAFQVRDGLARDLSALPESDV